MRLELSSILTLAFLRTIAGASDFTSTNGCAAGYDDFFNTTFDGSSYSIEPFDPLEALDYMSNLEIMSNVCEVLSYVPVVGDVFGMVGTVTGLLSQEPNVAKLMKKYVDAVDEANKISDIETAWNLTLDTIEGAMSQVENLNDFSALETAAGKCEEFFGYSSSGSGGGLLSFEGIDYSSFEAGKRMQYAPAYCNACTNVHMLRFTHFGQEYQDAAALAVTALEKDSAEEEKANRDLALTDLRYTLGRCMYDVLPASWDAVFEDYEKAAGDLVSYTYGLGLYRHYAEFAYNSKYYFWVSTELTAYLDVLLDYFPSCQKKMVATIGDLWLNAYRSIAFPYARSWAYLATAVSPNGMLLMDPPSINDDTSEEYLVMSEAFGAFLHRGVNMYDDFDKSTTTYQTAAAALKSTKNETFQIIPIVDTDPNYASSKQYYAIKDDDSERYLCSPGTYYATFRTVGDGFDETDLESYCRWSIEHVDEDEDPTLFNLINWDGDYLTANSTFQSAESNATYIGKQSTADGVFSNWRLLRTADYSDLDYGLITQCTDSSDCTGDMICDFDLGYCRTNPELGLGEICRSDEECGYGQPYCQVMSAASNRCSAYQSTGEYQSICDSVDNTCNSGYECSMEDGNNWGYCLVENDGLCTKAAQCVTGNCNDNKCDTHEAGAFLAYCSNDGDCNDGYSCNSDGQCDYADGFVLVFNGSFDYVNGHQSQAIACGGDLVSIRSDAENDVVSDLIHRSGQGYKYVNALTGGYSDRSSPGWTWKDGSAFSYSNFMDGWGGTSSQTSYSIKLFCPMSSTDPCEWQRQNAANGGAVAIYLLPSDYADYSECDTTWFRL